MKVLVKYYTNLQLSFAPLPLDYVMRLALVIFPRIQTCMPVYPRVIPAVGKLRFCPACRYIRGSIRYVSQAFWARLLSQADRPAGFTTKRRPHLSVMNDLYQAGHRCPRTRVQGRTVRHECVHHGACVYR